MALTDYHGFAEDGIRWRLRPEGVEIEDSGIERTRGAPATTTRIWEAYGDAINQSAQKLRIPCALIVATICTESSGIADAAWREPGYISDEQTPSKVSAGLMQTLLSTARNMMQTSFTLSWLYEPANSIAAGSGYIGSQARQTQLDPPLVAAAYNAGALYRQSGAKNRWKLRQYPIGTSEHCDRFVRFFNDAVYVLASHRLRPSVEYGTLLGEAVPRPRSATAPSDSGRANSTMNLSGASWVPLYPGSSDVADLEPGFREKVQAFIGALKAGGASYRITSTLRPPQRAYLMHWAWMITKKDFDPRRVPLLAGVDIEWWHGNEEDSRTAAQAMVNGYGIDTLLVAPALHSRHIDGKAVDMHVGWTGTLKIRTAGGAETEIDAQPRDSTNPELIKAGATYGVIHFGDVMKDRPHWSTDGR